MRLLAISYVLPPNLYPQAIQVGRLLYNMSAHIVAVCGRVHAQASGLDCYPDFDQRLAFRLEVPFVPRLTGLAHRIAYYTDPFYAKAPDEFRGWVPKAERAILQFLAASAFAPDALVSFGQPMSDHLLGIRLKRRLKLPLIAHFSDPWSDNPFRRQSPLTRAINRRLEAQVVEQADRIIFTSAETLDLVMDKYPPAWRDKARILPHGYEPHLYEGASSIAADGPLRLRHIGSFYGPRTPLPLFGGLRALQERVPDALETVSVELVGDVPGRFLRSRDYRGLRAGLIKITPNVEYTRSLRMMTTADLLLVIDAPADTSVFLPSKLVDYIGAGQPILGIVPPGTSATLVQRLGGEVVNPLDTLGVAEALQRAIDFCSERRARHLRGSWGDAVVRQEYLAQRVATNLADIVSATLRGDRDAGAVPEPRGLRAGIRS